MQNQVNGATKNQHSFILILMPYIHQHHLRYPQPDIISSVEDYTFSSTLLTLKPNPANHFVTITTEENIQGAVRIHVIASDGKNGRKMFSAGEVQLDISS
jgi:hypothetical protein